MAQTYTRVLEYKTSSTKPILGPGTTQVPLSSFVYSSGDNTHVIVDISSITVHTMINRDNKAGSGVERWTGKIQLKNSLKSKEVSVANVSMSTARLASVTFDTSDFGGTIKLDDILWIGSQPEDANVATHFNINPLYIDITYTTNQYYLSIPEFRCNRCDSSGNLSLRGEYCKISLKYNIGAPSQTSLSVHSLSISDGTRNQVYYSTQANLESYKGISLSFVFNPSSGGQTILPGAEYTFTVTLAYGEETVQSSFFLNKARAPFTFNNYSVGIGQYAQGTEGDERFDCDYPAYFYKGIYGIPKIQSGYVAAVGNTSGGSYKDIPIIFDEPFATNTTPVVVVGFDFDSTAGTFGRCCVSATSVTNAGFTMRFFNGDSSNRNPNFVWVAVGK